MDSHPLSKHPATTLVILLLMLCWPAPSSHAFQSTQQALPTDPPVQSPLALPVPANPRLPTLFLVGDSTVRNGQGDGAGGQWGWGEPLADFFNLAKTSSTVPSADAVVAPISPRDTGPRLLAS